MLLMEMQDTQKNKSLNENITSATFYRQIEKYIKSLCSYFSVSCCNAQVLLGVIEGSTPCFSVSCCNVLVLLGVIEGSFPCIVAGIYVKSRVIIEVYKLKAII